MKRRFWFISLLFGFIMVACSMFESTAEKPPLDFQNAYLNRQIQLVVIPIWNTFKTTDDVGLKLLYNTHNQIRLPENYNLRLFIKQGGAWLEIHETPIEREQGGDIILSPDKSIGAEDIVTFFPVLPDVKKQCQLRAYVFGDMTTSDGIIKVGAYTDIVLKP